MSKKHLIKREKLELILFDIIDKTLGEIDKNHVFDKAKTNPKITGIAGDVIEQSVLEYPANQDQSPDLEVDGVDIEVKTVGIRRKNNGEKYTYEAKEPATITAVSIETIAVEEFLTSHFWRKAENILFIFYEYEQLKTVTAAEYADFPIRGFCFNKFSEEDRLILQQDWQLIHDFIVNIQNSYGAEDAKKMYPDLSTLINKKTTYLDTAPKYPNRPRFRLRKRVVTFIIQQNFNGEHFEKIPGRYLGSADINKKCAELTKNFRGLPMSAILTRLGLDVASATNPNLKQFAEQVIVRMFGGTAKKMSKIEIFRKLGYIGKAVTVSASGARTEDSKLLPVDFVELSEELIEDENATLREKEFEDSELYHYLHDNKLLCVMFKEDPPDDSGKITLADNRFIGFKIIDLSDDEILSEARRTWKEARALIKNGKLKSIPRRDKHGNQRVGPKTGVPMEAPNLPKSKDHLIFFRGTGNDARDKIIVNGVRMLRQNYWIKGSFLIEKLKSIPIIGENKTFIKDDSQGAIQ